MDVNKVTGNIDPAAPVHSTRIRVGRSIDGFGLSPGITKQQRIDVEKLMSSALSKLTGDLAGSYYPLTGMDASVHVDSLAGPRNLLTNLMLVAKSSLSSPVEPVENLVAKPDALMTSPTSIVLDTPRCSWCRS